MEEYFLWYKVIHIVAVISWMAGLLYMPRLFAYHTRAKPGSEMDENFKIMEERLLRVIMNPAMVVTYIFGIVIAYIYGLQALGIWFHVKFSAVIGLSIFHGFLAKWRKEFVRGENKKTENFFRAVNEVPTVLMVLIVVMVVVKPFE